MEFADIDFHQLPGKGVKKITEEKIIEKALYPNQAHLAKVIVERFAHIIETNEHSKYKLRPLLEQANGINRPSDSDMVYKKFSFIIYTAISNMLEHQTAMRLADPESGVLSPEIYKSSWKIRGRAALSKVRKYHPEVIKSTHKDLVEEVQSNPETLFLIVADEAHVAITKSDEEEEKPTATPVPQKSKPKRTIDAAGDYIDKTSRCEECSEGEMTARERENANNTLVNFWKYDKHPNVIVLQVRRIIELVSGNSGGLFDLT